MRINEGQRVAGQGQPWSTCTGHIVLPYKLDRSSWPIVPTAPWDGEPDAVIWSYRDINMLVARSPVTGVLCGYAGVRRDHYMWGQEASDYDLRWDWRPHGGVTSAGEFGLSTRFELGLTVFDGVWWFGFDCGKALDVSPRHTSMRGAIYRDFAYVIDHVETLACALSTPVEHTTMAARTAWMYAGEKSAGVGEHHVRWLGTNGTDAEPFTRLDVEDYIGSWSGALTKEPEDHIRCAFTTLVKLFDGRFALVEAASPETDWTDSAGVAKCCHDLEQMRTYLARSNDRRVDLEMIHKGRRAMLAPLEAYCREHYDSGVVFGLRRKDIEEADAVFELTDEP